MNCVCRCQEFHTNTVNKLSKEWFAPRGYGETVWRSHESGSFIGDCHFLYSKRFTANLDEVRVVCPKHHPLVYCLAGTLHTRPQDVQNQIRCAWYREASGTLKVLAKSVHDPCYDKMILGLHKAWRGFCGNSNSCVYLYCEELGGFCGDEVLDYDDSRVDARHTTSSLGSSLWGSESL